MAPTVIRFVLGCMQLKMLSPGVLSCVAHGALKPTWNELRSIRCLVVKALLVRVKVSPMPTLTYDVARQCTRKGLSPK